MVPGPRVRADCLDNPGHSAGRGNRWAGSFHSGIGVGEPEPSVWALEHGLEDFGEGPLLFAQAGGTGPGPSIGRFPADELGWSEPDEGLEPVPLQDGAPEEFDPVGNRDARGLDRVLGMETAFLVGPCLIPRTEIRLTKRAGDSVRAFWRNPVFSP